MFSCLAHLDHLVFCQYPDCSIIVRDAFSCCSTAEAAEGRWLASDSHDICKPSLEETDYPAGCDPHKWHAVHTLEDVLFGFTIAILSFMMLEILVLMAAITPCVYFRHFWYVLDFVIVSVSLALEAAFKALDDSNLATFTGLLVVFRCWRFVRISHGLVEVTAELTGAKYEKVVEIAEELEDLVEKHQQKLAEKGDASDNWESDSIVEIQKVSKELAGQLLATQDEDNDEIHVSGLAKSVKKRAHHKSDHNGDDNLDNIADDGETDQVPNDNKGG